MRWNPTAFSSWKGGVHPTTVQYRMACRHVRSNASKPPGWGELNRRAVPWLVPLAAAHTLRRSPGAAGDG
jgi:hypothetical protein